MRRVLSFLVAGLIVLTAVGVQAASPSLELPVVPPDRSGFSAADNPLQASLTRMIHALFHPLPAPPASFTLSLREAAGPLPVSDLVVGHEALLSFANASLGGWQIRPSFDLRDQWNFLRRQAAGPGPFERLVQMFDVSETERPWATTTSVRLLAGHGTLIPYAAMEREIDVDEDFERYGLGAGAMLMLGKHASLGAEIMYLGGAPGRNSFNEDLSGGTRFFAHLQIEF